MFGPGRLTHSYSASNHQLRFGAVHNPRDSIISEIEACKKAEASMHQLEAEQIRQHQQKVENEQLLKRFQSRQRRIQKLLLKPAVFYRSIKTFNHFEVLRAIDEKIQENLQQGKETYVKKTDFLASLFTHHEYEAGKALKRLIRKGLVENRRQDIYHSLGYSGELWGESSYSHTEERLYITPLGRLALQDMQAARETVNRSFFSRALKRFFQ